ncbi:MAG TPA: NfeD family protein [Anaerolineales bacterium]|jgi:membrane-bound serine protease (ClpP class)|nr:NfeD family protein [Anaerolineales bacterium]HQX01240.1 NfeD family protein [Anaerolineales bacterium]
MDFLLEPNIAYLILLGGILLSLMAIVTPGTGLFEVGAFFCLALAGYAVYNLSFNWWAIVLLVLSVVPFIYSIQKPKRELYLGLSIALLVLGSVFLFAVDGWKPAVNPFVALVTSGLISTFLWIVVRKTVQVASARPTHDLELLMGLTGEARSNIYEEGSVYVAGEMWSARSNEHIPAGSSIRVVRREGFILVVEKID